MMTTVTPVRRTALHNVVPLLLGSSSLLAAAPALAQQSTPTQVAVADTGTPLPGEIIVTAQKRAESLQKVPISIQALGAATLEQHQVQAFDDYAKQLPSVSFQSFGPGQSQLFFRGISSGGDGLPGGALTLDTMMGFVSMSQQFGKPLIPILNGYDAASYFLEVADGEASTSPKVDLFMYQLSSNPL